MATPTLTRHELAGALGPVLVDVRSGGRGTPRPAVVILHGFKGFKDWGMFPPLAERYARAGFTAVTFNMSGSGVDDSGAFSLAERFGRNTFSAEVADTTVVLSALERGGLDVEPPSSIGLLGHSRGGGVATLVAARHEAVRALVTWAAIASVHRWPDEVVRAWRAAGTHDIVNARTGQRLPLGTDVLDDIAQHADALDIPAAAARLSIPWLIVHGSADEAVSVDEAERLLAASGRPSVTLEQIEGAGHTFGAIHPWAGSTPHLDRAMALSIAWMARHLT